MFYYANIETGTLSPIGDAPVPAPVADPAIRMIEVVSPSPLTGDQEAAIIQQLRVFVLGTPSRQAPDTIVVETRGARDRLLSLLDGFVRAGGTDAEYARITGISPATLQALRNDRPLPARVLEKELEKATNLTLPSHAAFAEQAT
jgi:hypothetical protein